MKNFFDKIDSDVMDSAITVFGITESQLNDYEGLKKFCIEHPVKIFDVIDHTYPYTHDDNNNIKSIIDKLKVQYNKDKDVITFLNQYSDLILDFVNKDYIFMVVESIIKILLL